MTSDLPEPADPHAAMRASDSDRDRVAETLSKAFAEGRLQPEEYRERLDGVFASLTFGELEQYTRDLPGHLPARTLAGPAAMVGGQSAAGGTPVVRGTSTEPTVVAVFGSAERSGQWTVPERLVATAVFGEIKLDLSEAVLAAPEVDLVLNAVLGSIQLRVPDDVRVTDAGAAILGSRELTGGPGTGAEGPLLRLSGVALLGSVEVIRAGPSRRRPIAP